MLITKMRLYFLLFISLLWSCSGLKKSSGDEHYTFDIEETLLDTLVVSSAEEGTAQRYRPTASLNIDILHTKLNLQFDWEKRHVIGTAHIVLKPYFKPIRRIDLDAIGFDIKNVSLGMAHQNVIYNYDGQKLTVFLDREYTRNETLDVFISYTAKPDENTLSGSDAITSDKGLFFINPLGLDPDVPTQIWTQGQTENNSKWFPTFDKPNERFTQEIILTVEDRYQTLSNGLKISSQKHSDGQRTDHWKLDKAHPPYLAMIAVGEFDEEVEDWNGLPVHYYVEKGFGKHAKKIFNHTKEMLSFFSDVLRYPYPWDKYSQIVVREFVSGAMENTGAVIFGDFVQKTERELIDDDNDYIVAHEMMHHWFGNYVTCEDWSNLTLNEGFANYAEYLWMEHKYGRDRADYHRLNELNGYYSQVYQSGGRSIIDYYYDDKEDMFDAHSYNKGGLVLHMLRYYLGDEVFFTSLNKYLNDHKGTAVEVDELRMAFEDVSGEDLKWFFKQWFLSPGHPYIKVKYLYNAEERTVVLETDLSATPEGFYKDFVLPSKVALYFADGSKTFHSVIVDMQQQVFVIPEVLTEPAAYVFDGENILLAVIEEEKTSEMYRFQFIHSPLLLDKIMGFTGIDDYDKEVIDRALNDDFYYMRAIGINAMPSTLMESYYDKLIDVVLKDAHSEVRTIALIKLLEMEDFDPTTLCQLILTTEKAYPVLEIALKVLASTDPDNEKLYFDNYKNEESDYLASTLVQIMNLEDDDYLAYLESKAKTIKLQYLFEFYEAYQAYLEGKSVETLERTSQWMLDIASSKDMNMFRRYSATMTLVKIADDLDDNSVYIPTVQSQKLKEDIKRMLQQIKATENHPTLKIRYKDIE